MTRSSTGSSSGARRRRQDRPAAHRAPGAGRHHGRRPHPVRRRRSSQRKDSASESYFDLEFGIGLPGSADPKAADAADPESAASTGGLTIRANVADQKDQSLIPGDSCTGITRAPSSASRSRSGNRGTAPRAPVLPALLGLQAPLGRSPLPLRITVGPGRAGLPTQAGALRMVMRPLEA